MGEPLRTCRGIDACGRDGAEPGRGRQQKSAAARATLSEGNEKPTRNFQPTRWPSVAGAVTPAAQPLQVGSSNSHPYPPVRPVPRTESHLRNPAGDIVCKKTAERDFLHRGCKARPSGCRSSVRSRRSRLGPHRWIGAEPPPSSASTKAAPATTQPWQLSGDTEAQAVNQATCGR
jgi:hypothetical protein